MNLLSRFLKEQAVYVTLSVRSSLKGFVFTELQVTLLSSIVFDSCSRNCQAAHWEQVSDVLVPSKPSLDLLERIYHPSHT